jgi:predicted Zn-dependent protease with MMP-like domain
VAGGATVGGGDLVMMGGVITIPVEQFEQLVADALDGIPAELGAMMDNVAVMVDDVSPSGRLFGLYQGVPLTSRGNHYSATGPDRITIYMATICGVCHTTQEVVDQVRKTVIHEVGHHFGIDDPRLEELGWA